MQTDPNWGNFLYDENKRTINLIDFGAARDYPKRFVDDYLRMVNIFFAFKLFQSLSNILLISLQCSRLPNKILWA